MLASSYDRHQVEKFTGNFSQRLNGAVAVMELASSFTQRVSNNVRTRKYINIRYLGTAATAAKQTWETQGNRQSLDAQHVSLLQSCTNMKEVQHVHTHILITGMDGNISLVTKLVTLYAMFGSLEEARLTFDTSYVRNVWLWNAMIRGYCSDGIYEETIKLYCQMHHKGTRPNNFTFPFLFKACAGLLFLREGKTIHCQVIRSGFESDVYVGAALVDMYAKCREIEDARQVFEKMPEKDVASWTAMIAGHAQNGQAEEARMLFRRMQEVGEIPNCVTMASVLPACADLGALQEGKGIHGCVIRNVFESNMFVGTALVDMYAKCGSMEFARQVFDRMSKRNVVSWSAMISGYALNGHGDEALRLFNQMQLMDVKPNSVTMVSVLLACAHLGGLQQGKRIHDYIIRSGLDSDVSVGTALIDMYAKCGNIEMARNVFDNMSTRDVVSWSAMIVGYGLHGYSEDALLLFTQMREADKRPNEITFIGVLAACSHAGRLDEGRQYFDCMTRDYCITPSTKHYACMVDLHGRAGQLEDAYELIKRMPLEPDAGVWGALLGACRIHCNIELAEHVAEHLFALEPENAGYYVLLSNIYAAAGRWDNVIKIRVLMRGRRVKKPPGYSFIEMNGHIHAFIVGDRSHPQSEEIYAMLESLAEQMKDAGYVANKSFVLQEVADEVKEHILCSHSEKLAIAFGLINTGPGIPLHVTKNLRVCGDCHTSTKFISKIAMREIIVRDANRFHHFKDGLCSCRDYW